MSPDPLLNSPFLFSSCLNIASPSTKINDFLIATTKFLQGLIFSRLRAPFCHLLFALVRNILDLDYCSSPSISHFDSKYTPEGTWKSMSVAEKTLVKPFR